jgi:O-antigen ligase
MLLATLVPLVLSGSRSSMIAVGLACLLLGVAGSARTRMKIAVLGAALFISGVLVLAVPTPYGEWLTARWQAAEELAGRDDSFFSIQFTSGLRAFRENPLLGIGKGGFSRSDYAPLLAGEHHELHNWYLATLVETGIAGLACLLLALGVTGRQACRMLRDKNVFIAAPAAFYFGALVMGFHGIVHRERGFWIVAGYIAIAARAKYASLRQEAQVEAGYAPPDLLVPYVAQP